MSERDIDLLLLEEFVASPTFARWFAEEIGLEAGDDLKVASARRSVTQLTGESDLEVVLSTHNRGSCYLLIENKIAAAFRPRQAERYRERGHAYKKRGVCESYTTVLIAPSQYLGDDPQKRGFDHCIPYESIRSWFRRDKRLGSRGQYKQALLTSAIDKAVHGYQSVEDAPVTDFWRSYWLLALRVAPELEMAEPLAKPSRAGFIYFRPGLLPRGVCIVHKLRHGRLDLQIAQRGGELSRVRSAVADALLPGMTIERAGKSAVIRQKVPVFDTGSDFQGQERNALACLERARELLRWYVQVKRHAI